MVDERLWQLLHDCDDYLVWQRKLLLRASLLGSPLGTVAMEAALDQLSTSVTAGWEAAIAEDQRSRRPPEPPPWTYLRGEPGE